MLELDSDQKLVAIIEGSSRDCGGRLREKIEPKVPCIFLESVIFQINKVTLQVKMATEA